MKIKIPFYKGLQKQIHLLCVYLEKYLKPFLAGAYVHGSVGSGEEIAYSDLDALVIIKKEVWEQKRLLKKTLNKLRLSEKIMYQFDPLQHHGWFILNEADLDNYPENYLPVEVLRQASSLFPDIGIELDITPVFNKKKVLENFTKLAEGIKYKLKSKKIQRNPYYLKGFLSQFMLLPALYVQVRDGKGVYKKQSFDLARCDFMANEWSIMDEVSEIRLKWHYSISALQRFLLTRSGRIRTYCARYMPIAIPNDIKSRLIPDFYRRIELLVAAMENKVL